MPDIAAHPRPDRRRTTYVSLDGPWDFSFADPVFDRTITVPFAYQCAASGIGSDEQHEVLWYRRRFAPPPRRPGERLLLHFGAVDFAATVSVNGREVGSHRGGHTSFSVDATAAIDDPDAPVELTVRVVDEFRSDQVRGKQTATFPYLVHYTPTSGIWLPVWAEVAGSCWVRELTVRADADGCFTLGAELADATGVERLGVTVSRGGTTVAVVTAEAGAARVEGIVDPVEPWSPASPVLYDLAVEVLAADGTVVDRVESYAGFRTLGIDGDRWLLNGEPLRQRLLLDQGYWPESLLTPPSPEAIAADLDFVSQAGFDGVRKHQKLEDPRWLHEADRRGVLVWVEMPSPFGLARIRGALAEDFRHEWDEAVRRDRNHPAVICWVPFNESWGIQGIRASTELQDLVRSVVAGTRALDPTRPVVDNSGWCHVDTDVVDVHDYDQDPERLRARWTGLAERSWDRGPFDMAGDAGTGFDLGTYLRHIGIDEETTAERAELLLQLPVTDVWADGCAPEPGTHLPLFLSEFGGVGFRADAAAVADRFDYAGADDADDLLARFRDQVDAVERIPGLCGWCWTQLSDVEQEINGLLGADRTPKVDPARLRAVLDAAPWSVPS